MYVGLHVKYPLFLADFNKTWIPDKFSKNTLVSNFIKIHPVGAESYHADGQTYGEADRHDEANICLLQFCEHTERCPSVWLLNIPPSVSSNSDLSQYNVNLIFGHRNLSTLK